MLEQTKLLMLSAMYENGGNTTHRFLDGHPQMFVYPFESQLGTTLVNDSLGDAFPKKYRWPEFSLSEAPRDDYRRIIDEEAKVRARTPHVSKFRDHPFELDDDERCRRFVSLVEENGRSRGGNVAAFFRATFDSWHNVQRTGDEVMYVGYSPIVVVDADKILADLPAAHVLHIVRNPWSAYADTKKRPVPLSLERYFLGWTLNQYFALLYRELHPGRVHIVRLEDVLRDPEATLGELCERIGLRPASALARPSWNGQALEQVYPWGTIRQATPRANHATALELSTSERQEIALRAREYVTRFGYAAYLETGEAESVEELVRSA